MNAESNVRLMGIADKKVIIVLTLIEQSSDEWLQSSSSTSSYPVL